MKPILITVLMVILFCTPDSFGQQDVKSFLTEVDINGQKIQLLRVPEHKINSRVKKEILAAQKKLERSYQQYLAKQRADFSWIDFDMDFVKQDPNWQYSYYEQEIRAYSAYNKVWEQRKNDSIMESASKRREAQRLAEQINGFSFINKPFVLLKENPSVKSMTMAKIYLGSYVQVQGYVEKTADGYVAINIGKAMTGFIKADDVVDSLHKVEASTDELALFRSREYYKFEESAEYQAMIKKLAGPMPVRSGGGGGRTYHVGPRGGCYYINAKGNKVYVDHSYCR
jgi:hypothetical protein